MAELSADSTTCREMLMRGKQVLITAAIALVVVVGFNTYQAKRAG